MTLRHFTCMVEHPKMEPDQIVAVLLAAARSVLDNRYGARAEPLWARLEPGLRSTAALMVRKALAEREQEKRLAQRQDAAQEAVREKANEEIRAKTEAENAARAAEAERERAQAIADDPENVPMALRKLDPEQRAAAMTNGRVRVSAGAGSGKSTTLIARIEHLIQSGAKPDRIVAMSFNSKAAAELATKLAAKIGDDKVYSPSNRKGVQVGTMHSLFRRFIGEYGTPQQKAIFASKGRGDATVDASVLFRAVKKIWEECYGNITKDPENPRKERDVPRSELWKVAPKSKRMMAYLNIFQGEGMSFEQARRWAREQNTIEAEQAIRFYEIYEGLKGAFGPSWRPSLPGCDADARPYAFDKFVRDYRDDRDRVGDFNDMLSVFRDIVRDGASAREAVQKKFDHVLVDECQDLNPLQSEILELITQHIAPNDSQRSFWMVGDDKQSIYGFRGSDTQMFIDLDKKGFKDRQITTNYRCAPEFVDAANRLIAFNQNQIPMVAKARPGRARGEANLIVDIPDNAFAAASLVLRKVLAAQKRGEALSDFAVLSRTNEELGAYQFAASVAGLPFVQKKAGAVFSVPETEAFRGFAANLLAKRDADAQRVFGRLLLATDLAYLPRSDDNKPREEKIEEFTQEVERIIKSYARSNNVSVPTFDPVNEAMREPSKFLRYLFKALVGNRAISLNDKQVDDRIDVAAEMMAQVSQARDQAERPGEPMSSKNLFDLILTMPTFLSRPPAPGQRRWTVEVRPFSEATKERIRAKMQARSDERDVEMDDEDKSELGALGFLSLLMDPNAAEEGYDPTNPVQFLERIDGIVQRSEELRIDPDEWEKKQAKEGIALQDRKPPPGLYLGTVHSTKGAEWDDVTVLMPAGVFPSTRKEKKAAKNEVPEEPLMSEAEELEADRRLGYVALTRARKNLTVLCPVTDPKRSPLSPFVKEAGLKVGQNVTTESGEAKPDAGEALPALRYVPGQRRAPEVAKPAEAAKEEPLPIPEGRRRIRLADLPLKNEHIGRVDERVSFGVPAKAEKRGKTAGAHRSLSPSPLLLTAFLRRNDDRGGEYAILGFRTAEGHRLSWVTGSYGDLSERDVGKKYAGKATIKRHFDDRGAKITNVFRMDIAPTDDEQVAIVRDLEDRPRDEPTEAALAQAPRPTFPSVRVTGTVAKDKGGNIMAWVKGSEPKIWGRKSPDRTEVMLHEPGTWVVLQRSFLSWDSADVEVGEDGTVKGLSKRMSLVS